MHIRKPLVAAAAATALAAGAPAARPASPGTRSTGSEAVHGGLRWKAQGRTRNETPGTTGDRGVWKNLGAC